MIGALRRRWRLLAGEGAAALGEDLINAYREPQRRYHGISHVAWLLDEEERRAALIANRPLVQFAIWFHDAVYDPKARDNEEHSADWASRALVGQTSDALRTAVCDLILMTKDHAVGAAEGDAALFLDMDIAILGAPRTAYERYAAGVRAEYAHVPDAAFAAGRGAFLDSWMARPRLFQTDFYETELAAQARANMAWERAALATGA